MEEEEEAKESKAALQAWSVWKTVLEPPVHQTYPQLLPVHVLHPPKYLPRGPLPHRQREGRRVN